MSKLYHDLLSNSPQTVTIDIPIDIGIAPLSDFTIEDIKVPNDINISPSNNIPINTTFIFIIKFITSTYSGFTI